MEYINFPSENMDTHWPAHIVIVEIYYFSISDDKEL